MFIEIYWISISSAFIEACYDKKKINEIIEYNITNEEPIRFKKNWI